jgi:hypothetical protein
MRKEKSRISKKSNEGRDFQQNRPKNRYVQKSKERTTTQTEKNKR